MVTKIDTAAIRSIEGMAVPGGLLTALADEIDALRTQNQQLLGRDKPRSMTDKVTLELTDAEAEWLAACLGLVMQLSRHWDNLDTHAPELANAVSAKLTYARLAFDRSR